MNKDLKFLLKRAFDAGTMYEATLSEECSFNEFIKYVENQQLSICDVGSSLREEKKTRLLEWKELNLLPNRVQNLLIMIYEYNYQKDRIIYLEDLKWQEFKKYKQAGRWSWAKFQEMRGY